MKAIILAAGKGERLKPITETRPKPLIPVLGKPLLEWWISELSKRGIERITVVVSYMHELIARKVREYERQYNVRVKLVEQGEPLGTGHALLCALKAEDEEKEDSVLVCYADVFLDFSYIDAMLKLEKECMLGVRVEDISEYGALRIDSSGKLLRIEEKVNEKKPGLINGGVYVLPSNVRDFLEKLKLSPRGEYELTDAINAMVDKGHEIRVVEIDSSFWVDVGRPWNILDANKVALNIIQRKAPKDIVKGTVSEKASMEGMVIVEEGAKVKPGVVIEGPVYIGEKCDVGPNSYIRPYTVLCSNVHVGNACEIKASLIMEHSKVPHLSYVGDSVICEHVNLGAGTLIANLRFDDAPVPVTIKGKRVSSGRRKLGAFIGGYVKTGVNVSIMPGVKIGSYSWIAPGVVVYHDVPPRTFYRG